MASFRANNRVANRVRCVDKCLLDLDGVKVGCVLENISISGAMVSCSRSIPGIRPGDSCGLNLCGDPNDCNSGHSCRIARVAFPEVGISFLNTR